jgi:hypothetical protein
MIRCVLSAALLASALWVASPPAVAQLARPFPATALRGTLEVTQPPLALLNGQPARLSPSVRIRAANNLIVVSGTLVGQPVVVHYTLEPGGQLHDVWILREDERAKKPWPTTLEQARQWSFDPGAQVWTRP